LEKLNRLFSSLGIAYLLQLQEVEFSASVL